MNFFENRKVSHFLKWYFGNGLENFSLHSAIFRFRKNTLNHSFHSKQKHDSPKKVVCALSIMHGKTISLHTSTSQNSSDLAKKVARFEDSSFSNALKCYFPSSELKQYFFKMLKYPSDYTTQIRISSLCEVTADEQGKT